MNIGFLKMGKKGKVALGIISLHIIIVLMLSFAISYPNPLKAFRVHPPPQASLIEASFVSGYAQNTPYWFFKRSDCPATLLIAHGRSHEKSYMAPLIDSVWSQTDLCILAIDLPAHGERSYTTTTIGPREKSGILEALTWLEQNNHHDVFLYGVSMGGSAIIHALPQKPATINVLGYITDGTYSTLINLVNQKGDALFIPVYIRKMGIALVNVWVGYQLEGVRPKDITPILPYPYLALHGKSDALAPLDAPTWLTINQPLAQAMWYEGGHDEPQNKHMQSCVIAFLKSVQQYPDTWKEKMSCSGSLQPPSGVTH